MADGGISDSDIEQYRRGLRDSLTCFVGMVTIAAVVSGMIALQAVDSPDGGVMHGALPTIRLEASQAVGFQAIFVGGALTLVIAVGVIAPSQRGSGPRMVAFTSWMTLAAFVMAAASLCVTVVAWTGSSWESLPAMVFVTAGALLATMLVSGIWALESDRLVVAIGAKHRDGVRRRCRTEIKKQRKRADNHEDPAPVGREVWVRRVAVFLPTVLASVGLSIVAQALHAFAPGRALALLVAVSLVVAGIGTLATSVPKIWVAARIDDSVMERAMACLTAVMYCALAVGAAGGTIAANLPWLGAAAVIAFWGPPATFAVARLVPENRRWIARRNIALLKRRIARVDQVDVRATDEGGAVRSVSARFKGMSSDRWRQPW